MRLPCVPPGGLIAVIAPVPETVWVTAYVEVPLTTTDTLPVPLRAAIRQ